MYTPFISQLRAQFTQYMQKHDTWGQDEVLTVFEYAVNDTLAGMLDEQSRTVKKRTVKPLPLAENAHSAREHVQAFWTYAVCDGLSKPTQAMLEQLDRKRISEVWTWYREWFDTTYGPDALVFPGRNTFCGRSGLFLTVAKQYFTSKRTREGRLICLRSERHE